MFTYSDSDTSAGNASIASECADEADCFMADDLEDECFGGDEDYKPQFNYLGPYEQRQLQVRCFHPFCSWTRVQDSTSVLSGLV